MMKSDKGFVFCVTPLEIYMFSFVFAFWYKNLLFRLNSSYIIQTEKWRLTDVYIYIYQNNLYDCHDRVNIKILWTRSRHVDIMPMIWTLCVYKMCLLYQDQILIAIYIAHKICSVNHQTQQMTYSSLFLLNSFLSIGADYILCHTTNSGKRKIVSLHQSNKC